MKSYRNYLRAIGRKPIVPDRLRTEKAAGTVEIVRDYRTGGWLRHEYEHELLRD